jgi:phage terminase small subunit
MMCEAWALYRAAIRALKKNPLDKDARISYAEYARQFANAASEFGMNPSDRSRIIVDAPKKQGIQGRKRG